VLRRRVLVGVHADRVLRTGLDAQPADHAAELIDDEDGRILLNGIVLVLPRLDVDALRRADRGAHVAGHAARLAVLAGNEAVRTAVTDRIGGLLLRVLQRGHLVAKAAPAAGEVGRGVPIAEEVPQEVPPRHRQSAEDLGDEEPLVPGEPGRLFGGTLGFGRGHRIVLPSQRSHSDAQCPPEPPATIRPPTVIESGCFFGYRAVGPTRKKISASPTSASRCSEGSASRSTAVIATFSRASGRRIFQPRLWILSKRNRGM